MKCHYSYDKGDKFWIPGCYSGIYSEPFCACRKVANEQRKAIKENDPEYKARIENKQLWKENAALHRIIEKLTKRKIDL